MNARAHVCLLCFACGGTPRSPVGVAHVPRTESLDAAALPVNTLSAPPSIPDIFRIIEGEDRDGATEPALRVRVPTEYATVQGACQAMVPRKPLGKGGACAPFRRTRTCAAIPAVGHGPMLVRVEITDTVPTEHCADYPGAPRTDLTSVFLAPAFRDGKRLRVALGSMVSAEYAFGMMRMANGQIEVHTPKTITLPSDETVIVLFYTPTMDLELHSQQSAMVVCEQSGKWCTETHEVERSEHGSPTDWDLHAIPYTSRLRLTGVGKTPKVFPFAQ
jgi:hypothetical protein